MLFDLLLVCSRLPRRIYRPRREEAVEETLNKHWLCMQEGTRDIQSAVKFRMGYTLVQREPRSPREGDPLPNINQYPILNQQEASKTFQATFEKDCGDNDVCESNMVTVANLDLPQGIFEYRNQPTSSFTRHKFMESLSQAFIFPFGSSFIQAKTAFLSWNSVNCRKSSWISQWLTLESRPTRPACMFLIHARSASSGACPRQISYFVTLSTAPWSLAHWATPSSTGK